MIVIVKLLNGVEVVGDLEIDNAEGVVLNRPLQLQYKYYFNSTPSLSLVRYAMFSEHDSVMFNKQHITSMITPREVFQRFYSESTDFFFNEFQKNVDADLESSLTTSTQHEAMKRFLEMMPVDKDTAN